MTMTKLTPATALVDQPSPSDVGADIEGLGAATRTSGIRGRVNFVRAAELPVANQPELIEGVLSAEALVGIIGRSGVGKTFFALDLICHIAAGLDYLGCKTTPGAAFYLTGEGQSGIAKRIHAWCRHHDFPIEALNLYVADHLPCLVDDVGAAAVNSGVRRAISKLHDSTGLAPTVVVIDTVARALAGADENSARDMGAFLDAKNAIRTAWSCSVISIHHTGHSARDRGRGSSAYRPALDQEILISEKGAGTIIAECTKSKDSKPFRDIRFNTKVVVTSTLLQTEAEPVEESSLVLIHAPAPEHAKHTLDQGLVNAVKRVYESGMKSERKIQDGLAREGLRLSRQKIHAALVHLGLATRRVR